MAPESCQRLPQDFRSCPRRPQEPPGSPEQTVPRVHKRLLDAFGGAREASNEPARKFPDIQKNKKGPHELAKLPGATTTLLDVAGGPGKAPTSSKEAPEDPKKP